MYEMNRMRAQVFFHRQELRRKAWDRRMFNVYRQVIREVVSGVLSQVESGNGKLSAIPSVGAITRKIEVKTRSAYSAVAADGIRFGLETTRSIFGRDLPIEVGKAETKGPGAELSRLGLGNVYNEVYASGMSKVSRVSEGLKNTLRSIMETSIGLNESRDQLATRIQGVMATVDYRATRIAQTETTRVFNSGSLAGMQASTVVGRKRWITNINGNPRPAHFDAHMQEVDIDEPFEVDGESLMYPGDPSGSPENTVNCHCTVMPIIGIKPGVK